MRQRVREIAGKATLSAKRAAKPVLHPFVTRIRNALLGREHQLILSLHQKADLLIGLHAKIDALAHRLDHVDARVASEATLRADRLLTRQDAILGEINRVRSDIRQDVERSIAALSARVDDVSIASRGPIELDEDTLALRTVDGFAAVPRADKFLQVMLTDASVGGLEPGTRAVITRLLRPGYTFVDVGAHIGLLTLAAARAVGANGRVHAFEPAPRTYQLLRQTVGINSLQGTVRTERLAIAADTGSRTFNVSPILGHSSLFDLPDEAEAVETIEVRAARLDDVISEGERVDLVKIDAEGAELEVLAGMQRLIAQNEDLAIIAEFGASHLDRTGIAASDWFSAFQAKELAAFLIDEETGACTPITADAVANRHSVNVLFAAPYSRVRDVLR